jgi:hypothetical protein
MQRGCWNCVHVWLRNMLGHYRDTELPNIDFFVIRRRDEPLAVVNKSEGIDRAIVLLVLLHDFFCVRIILENFLVGTSCKEHVLFVV